jgi:quinol monooxygenase YgiN
MSDLLEVIAILKPNKGKEDRVSLSPHLFSYMLFICRPNTYQVQELLGGVAKIVEANETGTLRYQLHKQISGDPPTFVVIETYETVHSNSEYCN